MSLLLWEEIHSTFVASLRSVGTACTLAAVGVYLHRRNFVVGDGKRTLALISQQVTIPLLFFTKILFCNQDWSEEPCPDITQSLRDVWVLLLWPAYVVGVGLAIGYGAAKVSRTPPHQVRAVLAACAFGNATGLPITLLTVVHSQFPSDTDLGRIDPTLFLSVYLLLYPVLQWGIGGWLLAPEEDPNDDAPASHNKGEEEEEDEKLEEEGVEEGGAGYGPRKHQLRQSSAGNVLNVKTSDSYNRLHRGLESTDASLYMSVQDNLYLLGGKPQPEMARTRRETSSSSSSEHSYQSIGMAIDEHENHRGGTMIPCSGNGEQTALLPPSLSNTSKQQQQQQLATSSSSSLDGENNIAISSCWERRSWHTIKLVVQRCLQPPVMGALLGMMVASQPSVRGVLVDLVDRGGHAPLQWMFDGLHSVGESAVPINMMILGCNLSASYHNNNNNNDPGNNNPKGTSRLFSQSTTLAIVISKMFVMPIVGFLSAYLLKTWWWVHSIPDEIGGSFYLVIMIVFLTPTANNVMVMVELSGGGGSGGKDAGAKEAMARIIAWQYAVSPIILSLTMTVAVCIAVQWS